MADEHLSAADAEKEFWKHLKDSNTGMLGIDTPGYHSQPMTAYREEESGTIWFFTRNDTDLARDIARGGQKGMFTYGSKDQEVWACFHGALSLQRDQSIIDKHWNPIVAAWYPDGKDDPHLTLIRFDGDDGRVWLSKKGPAGFFFEIAKANLTKTMPNVGGVADVSLA
ncbi:pyridoxamine 5'-phosphate oxidase family protein [Brevundimonas sp.]|uniref:pyridoxamine 5'-phosphate oxidase family protein n=1 Tax=Brevundimonas sp. TaxID=1871086 RepID=UPI00286CF084|nr:pyridoxamine 5'-phosphate oxidase family protein [Brevundimonas sp.]